MPTRFFITAVFCLALTGCILQSEEPLFSDELGELILAQYGSRFASYSLDGGVWKRDDEDISFMPVKQHYVASDGKNSFDVTFAANAGSWWVMQVQEADKPSYLLADVQDGELFLYPLSCLPLRERGKFGDVIEFKGDDCFVKDGVKTAAMFTALAAEFDDPSLKLVPPSVKLVPLP